MKLKKHIVSFLLAVALIIFMIPATGHIAFADPTVPPVTRPPRPTHAPIIPCNYAEDSCINCSNQSDPLCTTRLYYLDDVQP